MMKPMPKAAPSAPTDIAREVGVGLFANERELHARIKLLRGAKGEKRFEDVGAAAELDHQATDGSRVRVHAEPPSVVFSF